MSVWETMLVYAVIPVAICLLVALLVARKGLSRRPRYRLGEQWNYPPVWYSANPDGAGLPKVIDHGVQPTAAVRGGAHGDW